MSDHQLSALIVVNSFCIKLRLVTVILRGVVGAQRGWACARKGMGSNILEYGRLGGIDREFEW